MAKDRFYRSKPHVNVGAMFRLQKLGLSALGVFQLTNTQMVTNPRDRQLTAEILGAASGLPTGKRQHKQFANKLLSAFVRFRLLGLSALGIQQIALGQGVTDPQDQGLMSETIMEFARQEVKYYTITLTD